MVEREGELDASDEGSDYERELAQEEADKENNKNNKNKAKDLDDNDEAITHGHGDIRKCLVKLQRVDEKIALPTSDNASLTKHLGYKFVGDGIDVKGRTYYAEAIVGGKSWQAGDFFKTGQQFFQIAHFYEKHERRGRGNVHVKEFIAGRSTMLGKTADKHELFEIADCQNIGLNAVDMTPLEVKYWPAPKDWASLGGTDASVASPPIDLKSDTSFFYRMKYDPEFARFEDATPPEPKTDKNLGNFCRVCDYKKAVNVVGKPILLDPIENPQNEEDEEATKQLWTSVVLKGGVNYKVGDAIFIAPKKADGAGGPVSRNNSSLRDVDEKVYPELYRRKNNYEKGSNENTSSPFDIGIIVQISSNLKGEFAKLRVRCLYRPHQALKSAAPGGSESKARSKDFNLVYWSNHEKNVDYDMVQGKCFVRAESAIQDQSVEQWTEEGEFRFYFNQTYDRNARTVTDEIPPEAERYGVRNDNKGKGGKGKGKSSQVNQVKQSTAKVVEDGRLPKVDRPLRGLDVFAGCGGLSYGLEQAGIMESHWAIEVYEPAAKAFKMNHPNSSVFTEDCNALLKKVMDADAEGMEAAVHEGKKLPRKGDVEILAGGPPCQGFSGMNRFNAGEYSSFKNSLISSYLSYCDYYRPKFFILENVRNFASFKKSMVLILAIRALVKMGYQCTFGILQAGNFGVAQTRRRCILLAAAPGISLPMYPEPLHSFAKTPLSVQINDQRYLTNCQWTEAAPYRTVTVRDVMSDLPEISSRKWFHRFFNDPPGIEFVYRKLQGGPGVHGRARVPVPEADATQRRQEPGPRSRHQENERPRRGQDGADSY